MASSASERRHPATRSRSWARLLRTAAALSTIAVALLVPTVGAQRKNQVYDFGSDAVVPLRTHSIFAPYVESTLQNKFWDYGGDTIIDTNRHVRLTQDKPHQMGWLWSRLPITTPSYEISFEFRIDGSASTTFGDGLAMWLTQERAQPGPVFGSKDYFTGLGIFFDTFANARHPYSFPRIMAMQGNGVESYRAGKDGASQELAGCSLDVRKAKVATKARLTYIKDVFLELQVQYEEWDKWESCFKLEDVKVPVNPYLGFSALTGDLSDAHDIVSISSNSIVFKHRNFAELEAERRRHFPKDGSKPGTTKGKKSGRKLLGGGHAIARFFGGLVGFIWFLVKWGLVVAAFAGVVVVALRWRKARDAKRF
ncbi:unnamed protein product [Parajaminaea phylloscopi]